MSEETAAPQESGTGNAQPTDVADSTPNSGGPQRAAGGMGISSERVAQTGGGTHATDGERDTTERAHRDQAGDLIRSDAEFEQGDENNPEGLEPRADYPSTDPRHDD
jgi:hypothetical protein